MRFNQQADLASRRRFKKSILGLFVALFCAFFAAGCSSGGGGNDFVASPGGNAAGGGVANVGNGSVTFNFLRAQSTIVVPNNTQQLRFQFFTGLAGTGAIVKSETRAFATSVTIDDVPSSVRSVKVTALTAEGFPVAEFVASVSVVAGADTAVSSTDGTVTLITADSVSSSPTSLNIPNGGTFSIVPTVNFSNGEGVQITSAIIGSVTFNSNDITIATIDGNGLVTGVANGSTTLTIDFNGVVVSVPIIVGTGIVAPPVVTNLTITTPDAQPITLPVGAASSTITVTATFDNGSMETVNLADTNLTFNSTDASGRVAVNSAGQIAVAADDTIPKNVSFFVSATFMGTNSNQLEVQVTDAALVSVVVDPSPVELPFGGFEQRLTVTGTFTDGDVEVLNNATLGFAEGSALFAVDADGLVTSDANAGGALASGSGTITVTAAPAPPVDVTVTVGQVVVNSLAVDPTNLTNIAIGTIRDFTVTANLSNGTSVDVTNFAALDVTAQQAPSSGDVDIIVNGPQVIAVTFTPVGENATVTFTLPNSGTDTGAGPTDISTVVTVSILEELLVSARYFMAGIEITDNAINIPRGYVGVIEVEGTFNTGTVRNLNFNEYDIDLREDGGTGQDPYDAIREFNTAYNIEPVNPAYQDALFAATVESNPNNANAGLVDPNVTEANQQSVNAVSDRLYFDQRTGNFALTGSSDDEYTARDTFRAIVADWRRGEDFFGGEPVGANQAQPAPGGFTSTFLSTSEEGANMAMPAPGSVDVLDITISAGVDPVAAPGGLDLLGTTVTVVDPVRMSFSTANGTPAFVNYPDLDKVPVNAIREFDVRVDFDANTIDDFRATSANPPAVGPEVDAITGWKLAEANILLFSNFGGANQFALQAPTALGFVGVTSNAPVDVNQLSIQIIPVGGAGVRPINTAGPTLDLGTSVADPSDDSYNAGTYEFGDRIFGATPGVTPLDIGTLSAFYDPGPALPDADAQNGRDPSDGAEILVQQPTATIDFVRPLLFTLDPINDGGPLALNVGTTQLFRTLFQADASATATDVSLDYRPSLITRDALIVSSDSGVAPVPGRITVAAVAAGTPLVLGVDDVTNDTGFDLSGEVLVTNVINGVDGIVVALDVAGQVIEPAGTFDDLNGVVGAAAQAVTTINVP